VVVVVPEGVGVTGVVPVGAVVVVVELVVVVVGGVQPAKAMIPRVQIPRAMSFECFMKSKIRNKTLYETKIHPLL